MKPVTSAATQWVCPTCSKAFLRKGDLTRHKQLHTGVKPHICQECGKGFSQYSGLKTHKNVHTKLKPYLCGVQNCRSAFGDPSSCARHRKETHQRLPAYRCPVSTCRSSIKRRSAFAAHLRKHKINPYTVNLNEMIPDDKPSKTSQVGTYVQPATQYEWHSYDPSYDLTASPDSNYLLDSPSLSRISTPQTNSMPSYTPQMQPRVLSAVERRGSMDSSLTSSYDSPLPVHLSYPSPSPPPASQIPMMNSAAAPLYMTGLRSDTTNARARTMMVAPSPVLAPLSPLTHGLSIFPEYSNYATSYMQPLDWDYTMPLYPTNLTTATYEKRI
ncbi:hypothetical protein BDN72DRAFT_842122 [Pluteus cervinus]|uniref:Uncharacterized protein n=1 Tax=Pluteus cervinus TaxID=181527 RepID=A0ACD3ASB2_9AGAR|nr:hypothetical protein BDN72DRAFT_842122 [Pluteus cervinus]